MPIGTAPWLSEWAERNGYEVAGPGRDVVLEPPGDAGAGVFELQLPLRKV